jgi:hypothetical protein
LSRPRDRGFQAARAHGFAPVGAPRIRGRSRAKTCNVEFDGKKRMAARLSRIESWSVFASLD